MPTRLVPSEQVPVGPTADNHDLHGFRGAPYRAVASILATTPPGDRSVLQNLRGAISGNCISSITAIEGVDDAGRG